MKSITFVLTWFVFATPVYAWNEPDSFMGLKFWRPVSEGTMPECPLRASLVPSYAGSNAAKKPPSEAAEKRSTTKSDRDLARNRSDVLESIRKSRGATDSNLTQLEQRRTKAVEEYNQRRDLYYQGKIPRADVVEAENKLAETMIELDAYKAQLDAEANATGASFKDYDDIKTWELKKPCWQELGSDGKSHSIKNVAIGGFILDVNAESIDGKLAHVFIVFPQGDYGAIFLTFKERYGAPTTAKTETVQSRIGAKFKNEIFKWEGKRVTITLDKMGWTVDKGTVSYDTDIWRAHSAQKLQQKIKKAAKDL